MYPLPLCICGCVVFSSLDMSRSVSVTAAGQCRLAPLIQVILDCSHLYDYTVKLLFKLHSCKLSPCWTNPSTACGAKSLAEKNRMFHVEKRQSIGDICYFSIC